jgi:hypothetical protein
MAAEYPGTIATIPAVGAGADQAVDPGGLKHSGLHNKVREELLAIQTELGTNPSAAFATVLARLDAMQADIETGGGGGGSTPFAFYVG